MSSSSYRGINQPTTIVQGSNIPANTVPAAAMQQGIIPQSNQVSTTQSLTLSQCGLVEINATAGSLNGELPPLKPGIFAKNALAYDMMYGAAARLFLDEAKRLGATHIRDGLGMLVEQAAESFSIWHDTLPLTQPVLAFLRRDSSSQKTS